MKTINANTKRGQHFIKAYNVSNNYKLLDCYKSYSSAKFHAWLWCLDRYYESNGTGLKVISYNTMKFTVAWQTAEGMRVETANGSYLVK